MPTRQTQQVLHGDRRNFEQDLRAFRSKLIKPEFKPPGILLLYSGGFSVPQQKREFWRGVRGSRHSGRRGNRMMTSFEAGQASKPHSRRETLGDVGNPVQRSEIQVCLDANWYIVCQQLNNGRLLYRWSCIGSP